ncbi:MAG: DUF433 domain-containing protein [Chloroflexi bacterium]|nr:DUF433 domain-containing protein [Chloroflexota bacterium]
MSELTIEKKEQAAATLPPAIQYEGRPIARTEHPHIIRVSGVRGGEPIIEGTAIAVWAIADMYVRQQFTIDALLAYWPHVHPAKIFDALSYYFDHQRDIDEYLRQNSEEIWRPRTEAKRRAWLKKQKSLSTSTSTSVTTLP